MARFESATDGSCTIEAVRGWGDRMEFVRFGRRIYDSDPHYRCLPDIFVGEQLTPRGNPWFKHGEAQLFVARRQGRVVGRISAQIDREHLRQHGDGCGFFGFFESVDDAEVATQLLRSAEDWCRARGMNRIRGPFSFSINEVSGLLVDGFEFPNQIMMPHGRPYYGKLLKDAGYEKAVDLYGWWYTSEQPPQIAQEIADAVGEYPGLTVRPVDMSRIGEDMGLIMDIFNEAWSNNWGFVPFTDAEVDAMAKQFKLIAEPDYALIAEVDGEPAAMALALPNIHEWTADLDGQLFPLGWAKLLYRMRFSKPKTFRQVLLGVRRKFRGGALGGLSLHLYIKTHRNACQWGFSGGEAGWTLENNDKINQGMAFTGAEHYKTYRIFEKSL